MTTLIEDTQMNNRRVVPRVVLLACGSYSPPTPMHCRMFEIARDHFEMLGTHKVIGGIVSPTHDGYKKKGLCEGKHRLAMTKLALQSSNWIRVSDWEIQQPGWSRTISVLQYHQNYINNYINSPQLNEENGTSPNWLPAGLRDRRDPVEVKLLCGADLIESFAVPGLWADQDLEDLMSSHGLVVITRNGADHLRIIFESDILTKYQRNIALVINWVPNEISSTLIRRLLARGQSVKYLLNDRVIDYIKMNKLFDCKTKYITLMPYKLPISNNYNLLYNNRINMNAISSTGNTPSDEDDNSDEEHMDETDYSIKNLLTSFDLDNRKANVFCCGDNVANVGTTAVKPQTVRMGPGQAVQVITTEKGVTEMHKSNNDRIESCAKKAKTTLQQSV